MDGISDEFKSWSVCISYLKSYIPCLLKNTYIIPYHQHNSFSFDWLTNTALLYELAFIVTRYSGLAFIQSLATENLVSTWIGDPI